MGFTKNKEMIAMLLAGGQGSRLGVLTSRVAKPAVPFGGKWRIIDFPLSNCVNSGVDTIGVLTQYQPLELNEYIGNGQPWDLNSSHGGVSVLPPYARSKKSDWYMGTANAIYQNIPFIARYNPDDVLILSGDHIYEMDYAAMLRFHKEMDADLTVAVRPVPMEEASRFGIMNTHEDGAIYEFEEKPKQPKSNKASMGIYIFKWDILKKFLEEDEEDPKSENDFGKNIIPNALAEGKSLYAYSFNGYWKDTGTIPSYYEASMELLDGTCDLDLDDPNFPIYSKNQVTKPQYVGPDAHVTDSYVCDGCTVLGEAVHSVISNDVYIGRDAKVYDSVILHGARIEDSAEVYNAIIDENVVITRGRKVGRPDAKPGEDIAVVSLSDGTAQ